jgi:hypothetical protein
MKCPSCGKSLWFVRELCPFCKRAIPAPPRPRSVTVISWVFILIGGIALLTSMLPKLPGGEQQAAEFKAQHPFLHAFLFFELILAVVCGAGMLRGWNWARWVLVLFFGYNIIGNLIRGPLLSLFPGLLFGLGVFLLFRPQASAFFRGSSTAIPAEPNTGSENVCAECSGTFEREDMIAVGERLVCARCKPTFIQKLTEGAGPVKKRP